MGACLRRTGETHVAGQRMRDKRLADLRAVAGDDIDHAGRESGLLDQLHQLKRGSGREFGRLHHQCVTRRQGGGSLKGEQEQRRVPRYDADADAKRLVTRKAQRRLVTGVKRTFDLVGETGIVVIPTRDVADLMCHLGEQATVVTHLDVGERVGVLLDQGGEPLDNASAFGRVHLAPRTLAESTMGRTYRAICVFRIAARDKGPRPCGEGIHRLDVFP